MSIKDFLTDWTVGASWPLIKSLYDKLNHYRSLQKDRERSAKGLPLKYPIDLAEDYYERAEKAYLESEYSVTKQEATLALKEIEDLGSSDSQLDELRYRLYFLRGRASFDLKEFREARSDCSKAIGFKPSAPAFAKRGEAKRALHDYYGALDDYTQATQRSPNNKEFWFSLAEVNSSLGNYDASIKNYSRVIAFDSKNATAHNNRGICYGYLGDHDKAEEDFSKAINIDSRYGTAYNNRGVARGHLGRHDEAEKDFNEAITLNPDNAAAYKHRGVAKSSMGDNEGAKKDFSKAIELAPRYVLAYFSRGIAQYDSKDYEEALKDLNKAVEIDSNFAEGYHWLGLVKEEMGRKEEAKKDFAIANEKRRIGAGIIPSQVQD